MVKYTKRRKIGGVTCYNKYKAFAEFDGDKCSGNYPFPNASATNRPTCNTGFTLIKMCENSDGSKIIQPDETGKCMDNYTEIIQCSKVANVPISNNTMRNPSYDEFVSAVSTPSNSPISSPRSSFASISSQGGKRRRTRKNKRHRRKTRKHYRRK
jgi:hypothetical protein